jgi:pimeloyl-ACP methyl ester carboxylesterase
MIDTIGCDLLLHGVGMNGSLWRGVVADLRPDHRCVMPTLPLGGHRRPMKPDADLSTPAPKCWSSPGVLPRC